MNLKVEYQYSIWKDRDDSDGRWWVDSESTFKSKAARTRFINKMNAKYELIEFRAKGAEIEEEEIEVDICTKTEEEIVMKKKTVIIYTDGSAHYKDKLGGIGVYIKFGSAEKIISKGYSNTTNNRMEMRAIIEAMKAITLKDYEVHIYSDSELCINTFTTWIFRWEKEGFSGRKNVDLLKLGLEEYRKFPKGNLVFHWVKGHNGVQGNEIADMLASDGRTGEHHEKCR